MLLFKKNPKNKRNFKIRFFLLSGMIQAYFLTFFSSLSDVPLVFIFYFLSVASIAFTINRLRGIAEHTLCENLSVTNYTRSHAKSFFTFLIAPLNFNYHFEHHIFPDVSSYCYPLINSELKNIMPNQEWLSPSFCKTALSFIK
jgi:fatty acid desaturase